MSRVFVIEPPKQFFDMSSAEKFGKIIYVFDHEDRRCSAWEHVKFGQTVLKRLKDFDFDNDKDFICVVGSMLTVSISIIAIAQHYSVFNALLFHSVDDSYVSKQFNLLDWTR